MASQRDIQLHRPTGREWTVRSLCRRARSTALSCSPRPPTRVRWFCLRTVSSHSLGGGPLLRSSTLDRFTGVVVALGGAPLELVVASDMSVQFLQISSEPSFMFRVSEKIALRIREPEAIIRLSMGHDHPRTENGGGDNPGPRADQTPSGRAAPASPSRNHR